MLISNKYNFIYIHIYKTGGTSIQHALLPFVANPYERLVNKLLRMIDRKGNKFFGFFLPRPHADHITAAELSAILGSDAFDHYFSFSIVRNPWDLQVSEYKYILRERGHRLHSKVKSLGGFGEYIKWRCKNVDWLQKDFVVSDEGEKLVDFIGRYEHLREDFHTICSKLGVRANLPTLNVSNTTPYQEFYDDETKALVGRAYAEDIEYFGYQFE